MHRDYDTLTTLITACLWKKKMAEEEANVLPSHWRLIVLLRMSHIHVQYVYDIKPPTPN